MASTITSCQANQLLALQRELTASGLIVTVDECTTSCTPTTTATGTTTGTTSRKTATRKKTTTKRRGRPPKATTASRKMSKAGRNAVASASSAYHAHIKDLRETEHLTQKQARARYKALKAQDAV